MSEKDDYCISPCLVCPECESGDIDRDLEREHWDHEIYECYCFYCGATWCEIWFVNYEDED